MASASRHAQVSGKGAALLKGGHLPGDTVMDLLLTAAGERHWMQAPRIHSANTHGTGCTLSSAIAAGLALGQPLREAVEMARAYVHRWPCGSSL
jgi:hydroxymethylpyrimidine/phosphomethylpyrimidine kinase